MIMVSEANKEERKVMHNVSEWEKRAINDQTERKQGNRGIAPKAPKSSQGKNDIDHHNIKEIILTMCCGIKLCSLFFLCLA